MPALAGPGGDTGIYGLCFCIVQYWRISLFVVKEISPIVYLVLACVWSGCVGWFYNLAGAMLVQMSLRGMGAASFFGVALANMGIVVSFLIPWAFNVAVMATVLLAVLVIGRYSWDEVRETDGHRAQACSAPPFTSDALTAMAPIMLYCLAWGAMNSDPFALDQSGNRSFIALGRVLQLVVSTVCCCWFWRSPSVVTLRHIFTYVVIGSTVGLSLEMLTGSAAAGVGYALFLGLSGVTPPVWLVMTAVLARQMPKPAYVIFAFYEPALLVSLASGHVIGLVMTASPVLVAAFTSCCVVLLALSLVALPQMERCLMAYARARSGPVVVGGLGGPVSLDVCIDEMRKKCGLSDREIEVTRLLCCGRTCESCARILGISINTARTHVRHLYAKLGIASREELLDLLEQG